MGVLLDEGGYDVRVDDRTTIGDLSHGLDQLSWVPDSFFEQVCQTLGPVAEQLECVGGISVLGQDDDSYVSVRGPYAQRGVNAFGLMTWRHPDVGDNHIGP